MKHGENVQILASIDHGILSELVKTHKLCKLLSIDCRLGVPNPTPLPEEGLKNDLNVKKKFKEEEE